jgi:hypothetical protein
LRTVVDQLFQSSTDSTAETKIEQFLSASLQAQ